MATEVFHMDSNGISISLESAVFGQHQYLMKNIDAVATVEDKAKRWPGRMTLFIGIVLIVAGFIIDQTIGVMLGAVALLSGSINLSRKRSRFGLKIMTKRGPVFVLASQDKQYVETVSKALQAALERYPSTRNQ